MSHTQNTIKAYIRVKQEKRDNKWGTAQSVAAAYDVNPGLIDSAMRCSEASGVDFSYFLKRYLQDDDSVPKNVLFDIEFSQDKYPK